MKVRGRGGWGEGWVKGGGGGGAGRSHTHRPAGDARTPGADCGGGGRPRHPLEDEGYLSLGCRPCTRRLADEAGPAGLDDRGGRWFGLKKTECGLHLDGAPAGGTT